MDSNSILRKHLQLAVPSCQAKETVPRVFSASDAGTATPQQCNVSSTVANSESRQAALLICSAEIAKQHSKSSEAAAAAHRPEQVRSAYHACGVSSTNCNSVSNPLSNCNLHQRDHKGPQSHTHNSSQKRRHQPRVLFSCCMPQKSTTTTPNVPSHLD